MIRTALRILTLALLGFAAAVPAHSTVIDFGTGFGGFGGSLNIGANVTGSGLFIDTLTIIGAPINNGVYDVEGAGVCGDVSGGCGLLSFDKNLNTITLVGAIPALGILAPINLLSGSVPTVNVLVNSGSSGSISFSGSDDKARELLLALGLSPTTAFDYNGFVTGVNGTGAGSPYEVISTDITNTSVIRAPEPATLSLFSIGLAALAFPRRRKGRVDTATVTVLHRPC